MTYLLILFSAGATAWKTGLRSLNRNFSFSLTVSAVRVDCIASAFHRKSY